ncbi:hypothetical protein [Aeromicrobium ginsengisoli]|uniref:hypothetical protein n=1 Tax=Aeromicrobium ginsengisoli TaxID=363867 RepID=UPI00122C1801|nr:hypothetical protein [Aeromicrobium ginsengisoli]
MSRFLVLALLGVLLSATSPAVASCAAGAGPAGSATLFLGVAGTTSGGYTTMQVEEVWAGRDLPSSVRVLSGQTQANVSSSNDAELERGRRYVIGADAKLRTNACRVELAEDAMSLRPEHVRSPLAGTDDVGEPASSKPVVIAVLALLATIGAVAGVVRVRARR